MSSTVTLAGSFSNGVSTRVAVTTTSSSSASAARSGAATTSASMPLSHNRALVAGADTVYQMTAGCATLVDAASQSDFAK